MREPRAFAHVLSTFQPRKTRFGVFFSPTEPPAGGMCAYLPERVRTVRRAADGLPGSYFIVLPPTHPESGFCCNERGAELRDTLRSG